ncbi:MAG: AMP-binding protein [Thermodesulfobacteriota bacterium]
MNRWLHLGEITRINAMLAPEKLGAKDLIRSLSFRAWNERSCRLANALLGLGLKKGDCVGVLAYNCVEWAEIYVTLAKAGLIAVPIVFRLAPPEIEYILNDCQAKAFIVQEPFVPAVESIRPGLPRIKHYIYLGTGDSPAGYLHYEDLMRTGTPNEPPVDVRYEDVWTICYTSGTTGRPKGAIRTHESFIALWLIDIAEIGFRRDDLALVVLPMCHSNSINFGFALTYAQAGMFIYHVPSFEPEHLLKTLAEEKITFTSLVPTHYIMLLALPDQVKERYDVSGVRKLMCSSAPARLDTKLDILKFFKNSELFEGYGATETGLVTLLRPEDQIRKLGSIGREVIGTDRIRLLDDQGREVPDGEVGEIYSRGPYNFSGYLNRPEATAESYRGEFFSAGDLARRDQDGFYYLIDRKKNMIISGGENVYPSEVENVIGGHEKIKEVAIIGVPDPKWGEAVKAVVTVHEGVECSPELEKELLDFCQGKIAGFKRPKSVDFINEADMPRTPSGKILHRELRRRYSEKDDSGSRKLK